MRVWQYKVANWMKACFSPSVIHDKEERSLRFIEEATELVQSTGLTKDQVLKIVDYVYNRPNGELHQEVGGVMVTLAALCNEHDISIQLEADIELNRVNKPEIIDKIRTKQAAKVDSGVANN